MEQTLQACEYLASLASLSDSKYAYPKSQLDEIWRDTLINQFHDVLPGTSIKLANDDAVVIYEQRAQEVQLLLQDALAAICTTTTSTDLLVVDTLRIPRKQVVAHQDGHLLVETDASGFGQVLESSTIDTAPRASANGGKYLVENAHLRLTISEGRISSFYDKKLARELLRSSHEGSSGGLVLYKDLPLRFDAWDAEIYHLENFELLRFEEVKIENDHQPLVSSLRATAKFGQSHAELVFSLDALSSHLWIDGHVDWQEKHKFLKCERRRRLIGTHRR